MDRNLFKSWMAGGLSPLWGISPVRRDVNPIRIKSTSFFTTDISTTTIPASYITVYSLQCGRCICTVPIARAVRTSSTSTFYILLVHMPYHTNKVCTKYVHFNILSTTDISTATMQLLASELRATTSQPLPVWMILRATSYESDVYITHAE